MMIFLPTLLAYLGPETMLPMTSIVAGVVGVIMMFGRNAWMWIKGFARRLRPRGVVVANEVPSPHFRRIGSARTSRQAADR